jgi:hypothetical protein
MGSINNGGILLIKYNNQNVQVLQKFPFPSVNKSQGNGTHYAETCILETKMIKKL